MNETEHAWVQAAPFRAHLQRLLDQTGLPWTALAAQALVPPAVVHRLLYGRGGRPMSRIPREYARRLFALDEGRLRTLARAAGH